MAKILIVDDEENIREILRRYALLEDFEVFEAADGGEAVKLCASASPDIILMDIMMPQDRPTAKVLGWRS